MRSTPVSSCSTVEPLSLASVHGPRLASFLAAVALAASCGQARLDPPPVDCVSESDSALCVAAGKTCGEVAATDACGLRRLVTCGVCVEPEVCGEDNTCGRPVDPNCVPETDAELCTLAGTDCSSIAATDRCGTARTLDCGTCEAGTCGGGGVQNVCGSSCAQTLCGATCVDVSSSTAHCGACGRSCAAGQGCVDGRCGCPTVGLTTGCGASEVCDVAIEGPNGECFPTCTPGGACDEGLCTPVVNASGTYVDVFSCYPDREGPTRGERCNRSNARPCRLDLHCGADVAGQDVCSGYCTLGGNQCGAGEACVQISGTPGLGYCKRQTACPSGCWNGTSCLAGTAATACGANGGACVNCQGSGTEASCVAGACESSCLPGLLECGGRCLTEGPEACGTACTRCPPKANADTSCQSGACTWTCRPGSVACATGCCDAKRVATGADFSCVIDTAGGVSCWGSNAGGELGDGTKLNRMTPVRVTGLTAGVLSIDAGNHHACALTNSGGVKCWGLNDRGQVGDDTNRDRSTPVDVLGLTSGVVAISVGGDHSCAITAFGALKCWGSNEFGQLGDGTTAHRRKPVDVTGVGAEVVSVAAGGTHSCASATSRVNSGAGSTWCFGHNNLGQLGIGSTMDRRNPSQVSGLLGSVKLAAGTSFTCALSEQGAVQCWGSGSEGQLGDGDIRRRDFPVSVSTLSAGVVRISAGGQHALALNDAGGLKAWGFNSNGQATATSSTTARVLVPGDVADHLFEVVAFDAGNQHTCTLKDDGVVRCFGRNFFGQLGNGTREDSRTPVVVTLP